MNKRLVCLFCALELNKIPAILSMECSYTATAENSLTAMEEQETGLELEQGTESSKPYLVWTEQNRNWQNGENSETRAKAAVRLNGFWSKHIQHHSLKELESSWLCFDVDIWELLEGKVDKRLTFSKVPPVIYEKYRQGKRYNCGCYEVVLLKNKVLTVSQSHQQGRNPYSQKTNQVSLETICLRNHPHYTLLHLGKCSITEQSRLHYADSRSKNVVGTQVQEQSASYLSTCRQTSVSQLLYITPQTTPWLAERYLSCYMPLLTATTK